MVGSTCAGGAASSVLNCVHPQGVLIAEHPRCGEEQVRLRGFTKSLGRFISHQHRSQGAVKSGWFPTQLEKRSPESCTLLPPRLY